MFSHRLAESLLWLGAEDPLWLTAHSKERVWTKAHLCTLIGCSWEDRMRIERERGEKGRASEHFPTSNREEEEEVVKWKTQLEGEKEVKRREMRWRGREKRRGVGGKEEEVQRRRWSEGAHLNKWFSCREEAVEQRRDSFFPLCNRRLLHRSFFHLRRKLTSVLGCPPPPTVCMCGCARSSQPLFFSVFGWSEGAGCWCVFSVTQSRDSPLLPPPHQNAAFDVLSERRCCGKVLSQQTTLDVFWMFWAAAASLLTHTHGLVCVCVCETC